MKRSLLVVSLLVMTGLCSAESKLYTWTDKNGVKHFSDKPPQGSDRESIKGKVESGDLAKPHLNVMQQYTPPAAKKLMGSDETGLSSSVERKDGAQPVVTNQTQSEEVQQNSQRVSTLEEVEQQVLEGSSGLNDTGINTISGKTAEDRQQ